MSRKQFPRGIFSVLNDYRAWFGTPQSLPTARRSRITRRLGIESLEGRLVLSASPGATILGTVFNDLTINGLTADDTHLQGVTVNLYRDGGNGTFQGTAAGTDDTFVAAQQTDASGKYKFDVLAAGTYYVQELAPAGYVLHGAASGVATVVVSNAALQGVSGLVIDSFTTNQLVDASSLGSTTVSSSVAAPEAIGGHRDMFAQLTTGVGDVNLNANAFGQHLLEYNSSATGSGNRIVTWDGPNSATPQVLNPTGLNHADLTGGGASTGINLALGADHNSGLATVRVYKDANDWSTATLVVPNTGGMTSQPVFVPYSSFTIGGGAGAGDFTDVGAIQLQLGANAAYNGQVSLINTAGPTQLVANLANYQPASVGDLVFWDLGKTGIQTAVDSGAANVAVQLLQNGSIVGSTTTNAQGAYHFNGLAPGAYSVKFIPPHNSIFTLQGQGANSALDSDANPATGATSTFTLISGQNDTTRDAGLLPIDLSVAKTVDNPTPTVGSNVTFTMTLSNAAGYSPATGVIVSDLLPGGLTFVSATPAGGTTYNSGTGVWNVGNLASGASTTLTITATAVTGGTKTNTVLVSSSDEPNVGTVLQASASVTPPGSIGDLVFWDMGKTGIQAASDPGVANVTVQLLQNGSIVGSTTTNAQGAYHFNGIAPGVYSVKFIPPNNSIFTLENQGANSALDSDADPATGTTATFTLASGQNDTTHDAGLLPIDLSVAKAVDNPTPTVGSNVTFTMTLSNAAGYSPATGVLVSDVLPAGLTFVSATPAAGTTYNSGTGVWNVGNLASGASTTLTITATAATGGTKTNTVLVTASDEPDVGTTLQASASVTPPGSIGDLVFWDMGKTGVQTVSDPGAENVTVQLLQNGSIVGTTTTNAQGAYHFNGLAPGVYSVKFIPPHNSIFTLEDQGANSALDSDADPVTGTTSTFTLASGQSDTTRDAGLLPIDLSVTKAVDNPTPTVGSNVTFTMTLSNAAGYSPATGVTTSDLLPAGLTFVSATPAAGTTYNSGTGVWNIGNLASGANTSLTIIATAATGGTKTNTVQVTASDEPDVGTILQASASVTPPGSIGDFVFWDMGKTGVQTPSDLPAANVTVQLLQGGSIIGTTTTNAQGAYHFNGVAPGVYSVKFTPPNNAIFTLQHQGANPALDSDPNSATGATPTFTLASGQNDTTQDAGLLPIDLSVAKEVDNPVPIVGSNVTFTITLNNAAGYSSATGVTVSDVLPAGLNFVSAAPAAGTSYDSDSGVWNVGSLASGASTILTITATAITIGTKTNTAVVTASDEPDVGTVLQASADVTPLQPHRDPPPVIDLSLTKSVNNPTPMVGGAVTFTITLSNAVGFSLATGVTVNDALPAGLTFVSATPAAGSTYDTGTGVWTVGSLASGASTTLTITAIAATPGAKTNTATVTASDELDIGTELEGSATVTPSIHLSKALFLGR